MRIAELARLAGVTVRTVRYYVAEGLLAPPGGAGPRRVYTDGHLLRLRAIRLLKSEYLPLAEIRRRLAGLSPAELRALAGAADAPAYVEAVGRPYEPAEPWAGLAAAPTGPAVARAGEARFPLPPRPAARDRPAPLGAAGAAEDVPASLWRRVQLAPGVELSFEVAGDARRDEAIARLVAEASRIFGEPGR